MCDPRHDEGKEKERERGEKITNAKRTNRRLPDYIRCHEATCWLFGEMLLLPKKAQTATGLPSGGLAVNSRALS